MLKVSRSVIIETEHYIIQKEGELGASTPHRGWSWRSKPDGRWHGTIGNAGISDVSAVFTEVLTSFLEEWKPK